MSNKAELLKKIKALADRGVDGERESAQTLLARLMEQYGISETELEEERRETAWFPYSQETERRLLNQIIYEEILYADGEACEKYERRKPEGVAVELADCVIRILDYCGRAGIDIEEAIRIKHEYNKTRPYRHGGKKC